MNHEKSTIVPDLDQMNLIPFCQVSVRDTILDWVGKIESLGTVISQLSWDAQHGGSQTIEWCGEELGSIVTQYAKALNQLIEGEVMPVYLEATDGKAISTQLKVQLMLAIEKEQKKSREI